MSYLIGQTIDHYRVEHPLGQGGMGIIYQATDTKTQRAVALKVMHDHLSTNQQFRDRFLQEARAVSGLDHPNIVRVLEFSPATKNLYIVMELITGGSLREYLTQLQREAKPMDFDLSLTIVRQIADALHYAHEHNMIHRDVKPENILLKPGSGTYQAMLTDFGLAKLTEGIGFTVTGKPLGTFTYMSPEQCLADKTIDRRTDIYALGIVLYELTTGHLPFKPKNIMEALRMHTKMPVTPPRSYVDEYPQELEGIMLKCLEKNRDDRYATAKELANAIWDYQLWLKETYGVGSVPDSSEQQATDPGVGEGVEVALPAPVPVDEEAEPASDAAVEVPIVPSDDPPTQDEMVPVEAEYIATEPPIEEAAPPPLDVLPVDEEDIGTAPPPAGSQHESIDIVVPADVEQMNTEPPPVEDEPPPAAVELEYIDAGQEDLPTQDEPPVEEEQAPPPLDVLPVDEEDIGTALPDEDEAGTGEHVGSPLQQDDLPAAELEYVEAEQEASTENSPYAEEELAPPVEEEVEPQWTEPPPTSEPTRQSAATSVVPVDVEQQSTEPPPTSEPTRQSAATSVVPVDVEQQSTEPPPMKSEPPAAPPLELLPVDEDDMPTEPPVGSGTGGHVGPPLRQDAPAVIPANSEDMATEPPPRKSTPPAMKSSPPAPAVVPVDSEDIATEPPPRKSTPPAPHAVVPSDSEYMATEPPVGSEASAGGHAGPPPRQDVPRVVIPAPIPREESQIPTTPPVAQPPPQREAPPQQRPKPAVIPMLDEEALPTAPPETGMEAGGYTGAPLQEIEEQVSPPRQDVAPDMIDFRLVRDTHPFGQVQPDEVDGIAADIDRMMVYHADQLIETLALNRRVTVIGRDADNDVILPSKNVSRRHARIERTPDGDYQVVDMGATNRCRLDDVRLSPNVPTRWEFGQTLYIGDFSLRLEAAPARFAPLAPEAAAGSLAPPRSSYLIITMTPNNAKVEPGGAVDLQVKILNNSSAIDRLKLEVRGLAGEWGVISDDTLEVDAGDAVFTTLTFSPPRKWTSRAGRHFFTLRIYSEYEQTEVAVTNGLLHVTALQDFSIDLHPKRLHNSGETQLTITNQGNVVGNYTIQARDNENNLEFTMNYTRLRLEPGKSEMLGIQILPRQNALIHGAKLLPFEIGVTGDNLQQQWEQGEVLVVAYLQAQQPIAMGYDAPPVVHVPEYAASVAYQPRYSNIRERGVGLTLWLIAHSMFNLLAFSSLCYLLVSRTLVTLIDVADIFFFVLSFALGFFALIHALFVIFSWGWKRWALIGLLCFSLFVFPVGPVLTFVGWLLVRGKWEMFD